MVQHIIYVIHSCSLLQQLTGTCNNNNAWALEVTKYIGLIWLHPCGLDCQITITSCFETYLFFVCLFIMAKHCKTHNSASKNLQLIDSTSGLPSKRKTRERPLESCKDDQGPGAPPVLGKSWEIWECWPKSREDWGELISMLINV